MDEYIKREAILDLLKNKYQDMSAMPASYYKGFQYALKTIEKIKPDADVVPVQKWISAEDRLPEADVAVLARCFYHESWRTLVCYMSKRNVEWYTNVSGQWVQVTHWMPLPQPPKEE